MVLKHQQVILCMYGHVGIKLCIYSVTMIASYMISFVNDHLINLTITIATGCINTQRTLDHHRVPFWKAANFGNRMKI